MGRAVDNGITRDEIRGLVMQVTMYAELCAGKAALELLEQEP